MTARKAKRARVWLTALRVVACLVLFQFFAANLFSAMAAESSVAGACLTDRAPLDGTGNNQPLPASSHVHDASCCILTLVDDAPTIIDTIIGSLSPRPERAFRTTLTDLETRPAEKPERASLAPRAPPISRG